MSDLISREDVLAVLNKVIKYGVPDKDGKHSISAEIVFNFVKDMSPAQEWIPCSERLPIIQDEEIHTFIVTYYDKDIPNQLLVGIMIFDDGIWYKPECDEVIAWQPLPQPYKEDK